MPDCACQLHIWEDIHGTEEIVFFPEYRAFLPVWIKDVHDATAVYEYVYLHGNDWRFESGSEQT